MDIDRLLHLLIKKEEGAITMAEQTELAVLLKEHSNNEPARQLVEELFNADIVFEPFNTNEKIEASVHRLNQRMSQKPVLTLHHRKWLRAIAIAASILLLAGAYALYQFKETNQARHIVKTSKMSKSNMVLPDGTKVWLNADTKISYSLGNNGREVELDGEAYFDVVKDKNHPFIVHTKAIDIKVLGTAFNVRAYSKEHNTQATLLRGSIEVLLKKKNNERLFLSPNEKIVIRNDLDTTPVRVTDNAGKSISEMELVKIEPNPVDLGFLETQWLKPYISFDQQKLQDIIPMLENWYNVKITVHTPALLQRRFSARIENESLEEILESFRLASNLRYTINNNNVTLYK